MRSTNKRSRSKPNRPKTLGNILNRVFDSSGPEGKVRGTPQQIIEKYQVLARDAQLSNDRVAAENFQQHAEHYTRLLAQAQREMQAEQEARRANQQDDRNRQEDRNHDRGPRQDHRQDNRQDHRQDNRRAETRRQGDDAAGGTAPARDTAAQDAFSVQDVDISGDSNRLVETPESKSSDHAVTQAAPAGDAPAPKPANRRKPRAPKPAAQPDAGAQAQPVEPAKTEEQAQTEEQAAPKPKPKPRKYTRKPRNTDGGDAGNAEVSSSAAE